MTVRIASARPGTAGGGKSFRGDAGAGTFPRSLRPRAPWGGILILPPVAAIRHRHAVHRQLGLDWSAFRLSRAKCPPSAAMVSRFLAADMVWPPT